ncbi:hypothetical protein [Pediococcus acidilactici]|uniref:hypothetical protein n=1 Tax=Pediococcus acidilactici TaxID=1254 RepID=UPI001F346EFE|nr:hypothetical protein [Pediococcus acidilactici]
MTDLVAINESKSDNVVSGEAEVKALESHLDQLGVSSQAVLVGLGDKTAATLRQFGNARLKSYPIIQAQTDTGKLLIQDKQF